MPYTLHLFAVLYKNIFNILGFLKKSEIRIFCEVLETFPEI